MAQVIAMNPMVGPYLYIFFFVLAFGLLAAKVYLRFRRAIRPPDRPNQPISEGDIVTAVRARNIAEAIQLYGLLHRCDLAEAAQAIAEMAERLKAAEADDSVPNGPESTSHDHRET